MYVNHCIHKHGTWSKMNFSVPRGTQTKMLAAFCIPLLAWKDSWATTRTQKLAHIQ